MLQKGRSVDIDAVGGEQPAQAAVYEHPRVTEARMQVGSRGMGGQGRLSGQRAQAACTACPCAAQPPSTHQPVVGPHFVRPLLALSQAQQLAASVDAQQIQALAMAPPPERQLVTYEDL